MKNYKISVIIPCYSVGEFFLNEAINSVIDQTYQNWEIILVDDCSPEQEYKSEIVQNLIKDKKLKLINNKENLGLAISRNIGFDASNGELILFLDPDDKYKTKDFFEYANRKFIEIPNLDVIQFSHELLLFSDRKRKWVQKNKKIKIKNEFYSKIKIEEYFKCKWQISTWSKVYKKSFLIKNNIRHLNKNNPCEDWVFCFQIFKNNPNIFLTNKIFYCYRQRKNSIVYKLKKNKNHEFDYLKIAKTDIEEYLNRGGVKH